MEINLTAMAALLGTQLVGKPEGRKKHIDICTDSRKLRPGQIFWALKGENFDGHQFVEQAFQQGGYAAVIEQTFVEAKPFTIPVYVPVEDTNAALLALGKGYAAKFRIPKVAITGSNGKTTTKDMVSRILAKRGKTLTTQGNLNNQIGVPLTLFELKASHDYAVIEMGTNHPGEIKVLSEAVQPSIAVLTNIGYSHLEHFQTKEKIFEEKLSIVSGLRDKGVLIINVDDPLLAKVKPTGRYRLLTYGIDRGQIRPSDLTFDETGCASFRIGRTAFRLSIPGRHTVYNALAAIAVGSHLRVPKSAMAQALAETAPTGNRMRMRRLSDMLLIDDCYNANPSSMKAALATLGANHTARRRVAVLGDMLELGSEGPSLHREIGHYLAEMGVDELFTFGSLSRHINQGAREKGMRRDRSHHFLDFDLMAQELAKRLEPGDAVLVKASRGMRLERVYEFLKGRSQVMPLRPEKK